MLKGRLGLEAARIPHADRHGLLWLARGNLTVEDGTLHFRTAGSSDMAAGDYAIPFQNISFILLGPGSTVSHDVFRLLARHGTGLVAVGEDGVRMYSAQPFGPNDSKRARRQAKLWNDMRSRLRLARRMYAWRLGEVLPEQDISILRGVEGARMKTAYGLLAQKYGIAWHGRRYDRQNPDIADAPNQAINHAATAIEAAAIVAVAATGTLPPLGFIHEDASIAFCLDIADLYRTEVTIPVAFEAVGQHHKNGQIPLERHVRRLAGRKFREMKIISKMIDRIIKLIDDDDRSRDT